jgi:4-hydroxyacetophenone monooxygenase
MVIVCYINDRYSTGSTADIFKPKMSTDRVGESLLSHPVPDEAFVRRVLRAANLNVLRVALYYQTGDEALAQMKVLERPVQGGALVAHVLDRAHRDELIEKAAAYLISGARPKPDPNKEQAVALMSLFSGHAPRPGDAEFGYEDMGFEASARHARWSGSVPVSRLKNFRVTVVGAGFSGIAAAVQLDRLGIAYEIIERQDDIGGTWHLNDYPEARVDISSFLYQYKFEKNYPWQSYFATRDELKKYLNFIVDKYGVRSKIRLRTVVNEASWSDAHQHWELELRNPDGVTENIRSNIVISCSGLFSTPNLPDIPGIDMFRGTMFHTTAWDHQYDYAGRRIAMIGTGSTGCQLMPRLAQSAEKVTVFQRTANWIMPVNGYHDHVSEDKRWLLDHFPGYSNWFLYSHYVGSLQKQEMEALDPEWIARGGKVNERNQRLATALTEFVRSKVGDRRDLLDALIPDHPPLARRLVIDNAWFDALMRENVELVTSGIERIGPDCVIDHNGRRHACDLIVLSAGFKVSKYLWPVNYRGRRGVSVREAWSRDGARAYLTMAIPDFPNFFILYGPNSGVRGGSFHSWVEIFMRYIGELLVKMLEEGKGEIEVRREAFESYNARMDEALKGLLWQSEGQGGYFINEYGRVGTQMPWTADEFYDLVRKSDPQSYVFR